MAEMTNTMLLIAEYCNHDDHSGANVSTAMPAMIDW